MKIYDEPFFDSSAFPTMAVSRMTRRFVSVSLSGDGGDELFGGYHYYNIAKRLSRLLIFPKSLRKGAASLVGLFPKHELKIIVQRNATNQQY